jgi:hypothetical protein
MATTPSTGTTGGTGTTAQPLIGTESSLSNWVGPYVTNMLGKGQALASTPYQAYEGQLTAGPSALQTQAFQGLAGLTTPAGIGAAEQRSAQLGQQMGSLGYTPTTFTSDTFTPAAAQQYMNPYLQASLDPQIAEARRQAEIQRVQQAGRMTQAGAFGGSRQAIMESELARNLGQNLANITGQGYNQAYQQAAQNFQADQQRRAAAQAASEQSRQFGAGYGLQGLQGALGAAQQQAQLAGMGQQYGLGNLQAQLAAGQTQRGITSEGLAAEKAQFEEERDFPYKQVQYQQSLLQGLPLAAQTNTYQQPSLLQEITGGAGGIRKLYEELFGAGTKT